MFSKLKNFFKNKKKNNSTKANDDLNKGLPKENKIHYENIIPNLVNEFINKNISDKKRSNSFSSKNKNLCLSKNKLVHSNSGLLFKFTKKTSKNISLERQYFIETKSGNIKHLTSKYVRRGTFTEINDNLKIENIENTDITNLPPQNKENNNSFKKTTLKRRKTLDPQNTVQAEHIQFVIAGDMMDIQDTKEKLEEYQEKMRKTQLRYYVFKKITDYKSSLRIYFQKYRNIVQLMEALDEKNEENKEDDEETMKKKIKILKNILKNRTFKEHKELNKYLLRFYYNSKYAAGIANLSKILNKNKNNENKTEEKNENKVEDKTEIETKVENKSEEINNNNDIKNVNSNNAENVNNADNTDNTDNNNNHFINVIKEEIKKEDEKKELTQEEIEKAKRKRNKELRDLFYNKIRERQKWLHDHFVKFYYKGLLWAMKTGNIKNNTSSSSESNTENNTPSQVIDNTPGVNNNTNENNLVNKTSSEIDTLNINKEIEKKEEKEEESQKNEESQKKEEIKDKKKAFNKIRDRSKGLRKLLSEKNKEKTNILRKYFFKFLSNGILLSLKKTTLKSSKTLTKMLEDDIEKDVQTEEEKKEEEENNWIIEEKKRRKIEEEQKQKELMEKRIKKLVKIFNKKDQILCGKERSCLQKWNLRAKIIAISDLTDGYKKTKKTKGKKKIKKKDKDTKEKNENEEKEESKE